MGQKDFSDWNGRKRREQLYPSRERLTHFSRKSDKEVGFKTKVDRFRAVLKKFLEWKKWRHEGWVRYRRNGERDWMWHRLKNCWYLKDLRKLKVSYLKEGIYEKVLAAL